MKSERKVTERKIPEKYQPVPLVPEKLLMLLWAVSLVLPNLIYSGVNFADTLHIIKWTVTGVPIAIALIIAGARILIYGHERLKIKIDVFAVIWLVILIYCGLMPLWTDIMSPTSYVLEMVCFSSIWAFYVLSVSSFPSWGLRPVILLANLNASINIIFAELQIRNMNNLAFLQGTIFEGLRQYSTIILPTPGNYIGNTAQQNMFGLWCAVAVLGAVYLYVYDAHRDGDDPRKVFQPVVLIGLGVLLLKNAVISGNIILWVLSVILILSPFVITRRFYATLILILMSWNFWGLMNSTSRSATLALLLGLGVILIISFWKFDRTYVLRFAAVILVLVSVFYVSLYSPRSEQIVDKTADIVRNAENIGNRRGIWMTSYAMLMEHPKGVGIGQYKWHYLEGQRYGFKMVNERWYRWQYTHWAHNEFLQFFCEGGWIGGTLLILMWLSWLIPVIIALFKRQRLTIGINSVWGISLATLITFCALFTRPFHRIENMVWITLAFALSNREFFSERLKFGALSSGLWRKLCGLTLILASIAGCVYISSGIYGNYILRKALSSHDGNMQLYYLNEADKHPIVHEEAQRNLGYHYMQRGEQTNNGDEIARGFNILWQHFNREPHSEDISKLLNFAQRYQIEPVIREIASYFRPGDYHLKRVPQQDSAGRRIRALLLVNGPGSDDR
ncbi:MAG: O-antigen ligase family protein [Synergistaceae bacterium]|nr:O-antigen ligase family protein [Synergistaceae bacterium]